MYLFLEQRIHFIQRWRLSKCVAEGLYVASDLVSKLKVATIKAYIHCGLNDYLLCGRSHSCQTCKELSPHCALQTLIPSCISQNVIGLVPSHRSHPTRNFDSNVAQNHLFFISVLACEKKPKTKIEKILKREQQWFQREVCVHVGS